MIGRPDLLDDERFKDDLGRGDNGEALSAYMAAWCADRTTDECLAEMDANKVPGGPVLSPQQLLDLPHVRQVGILAGRRVPDGGQAGAARRVPRRAVGLAGCDPRPGAAAGRAHRRDPGRAGLRRAAADRPAARRRRRVAPCASVLVVGAGPTGLVLAAELCRRGVPCELIDERSGPQHWDRATVVHPGSLEVFEAMGHRRPVPRGRDPQRGARLHAAGEVLGEYEITDSGSTYPYNLGLSEEVTESILTDHLRASAAT